MWARLEVPRGSLGVLPSLGKPLGQLVAPPAPQVGLFFQLCSPGTPHPQSQHRSRAGRAVRTLHTICSGLGNPQGQCQAQGRCLQCHMLRPSNNNNSRACSDNCSIMEIGTGAQAAEERVLESVQGLAGVSEPGDKASAADLSFSSLQQPGALLSPHPLFHRQMGQREAPAAHAPTLPCDIHEMPNTFLSIWGCF
jgi:hypothetical protein